MWEQPNQCVLYQSRASKLVLGSPIFVHGYSFIGICTTEGIKGIVEEELRERTAGNSLVEHRLSTTLPVSSVIAQKEVGNRRLLHCNVDNYNENQYSIPD